MATGYTPPAPDPTQQPNTATPYTTQSSGSGFPAGADPSSFGYGPGPSPVYGAGGPTSFQNAYNAYLAYNAPTLAQLQNNANNAYQDIGYNQQLFGLNSSDLGLSNQMQQGDLATQIATNGLQQQRAQMDAAAYGRMMGYNTDVFNAQNNQTASDAAHQLMGINSHATASGAFTAQGTQADRVQNFADMKYTQSALEGNYKQQQEQLGMNQGNAQIRAQVLQAESANLGMKSGVLNQMLDNGISKLGLQNQINVNNLLDGLANNNLQAWQLYYQIIQQAGAYAGAAGSGQH